MSRPARTISTAGEGGVRPPSPLGNAVRVSCGNFLEMYDFMVFGYYAGAIGRTFFPGRGALMSLLLSFLAFGAGFLMRPLGAVVLGAQVDRIGLRRGLLLTLSLMAVGTVTLAVTPGYAAIGIAAPLLVLAGRLLQGFSAGVELGSTSVYLGAIASARHRGFWVSFQSASQQVAVIVAASLGVALATMLTERQMQQWGWRVPLLIGCAIVPLLLVLRRSLAEEAGTARRHARAGEIVRQLALHWRPVVTGGLLVLMTTVSFYLITAYTPSFGRAVLHLSARTSLVATLCVGLSNLFWLPVSGALSDRIGRRPILLAASAVAILSAYPAMRWLAAAPSFGRLLDVELWLSFLYGSYNGALIVFLTELIPTGVRVSGFSTAYSLATCIGGFTPAVCTGLIAWTGDRAMPGAWLTVAAAIGLATLLTTGGAGRKAGRERVEVIASR